MKAPRPESSRRGVALVISLAFIVLITIIVVAYFVTMRLDRQSTQNYSQSIRVQELAFGAIEEILQDLRKEMDAGSLQGTDFIVNGRRVYIPVSPRTAIPARIGFAATNFGTDVGANNLPPSFVRTSRAQDGFFSSPPADYEASLLPANRASAVGTDTKSANGKSFPARRWNKPLLMGTNVPAVFTNRPPEWIYITRSGGRTVTAGELDKLKPSPDIENPDQVLGRYAFVIYEQGGLLDINAAGFPSSLPSAAGGPDAIRGKSSIAFADLSVLPGLSGKTNEMDALLNWRSKGAIAEWGSFLKAAEENQKLGFREWKSGDSPLLGRQDLIDYFQKKVGSLEPLAYLSTFSRAVDAPSWSPQTPAGSTVDYAADAEKPASANRNLPNVRFKTAGTITHYDDEANPLTYDVKQGDPLLQSRFSLARLAWLNEADPDAGTGPSPTSDTGKAIKSGFGLVWDHPGGNGGATAANGGNKCWNYIGAAGEIGSPPGHIKTLDEVAGEGREPDFFELLKAAILSGSYGKSSGMASFDNGRQLYPSWKPYDYNYKDLAESLKKGGLSFYAHSFDRNGSFPAPSRIPDMQIIRIGANIIDQFDEDSYPTAIWFKYDGVGSFDQATGSAGNPIHGPATMAFGTENLPFITKVAQVNCSPNRTDAGTPGMGTDLNVNVFGGWRQPELWNPHQAPNTSPAGKTPTRFQIRAYGSANTFWTWQGSNPGGLSKGYQSGRSEPVDYHLSNNKLSGNVSDWSDDEKMGTLQFTISSGTPAFSDKPYPLMWEGIPGVSATSPHGENLANPNMPFYSTVMSNTGLPNHFAAFSTGLTPATDLGDPYRPYYVIDAGNGTAGGNSGILVPNTYVLGWQDSSGGFHPYSFFTGFFGRTYSTLYPDRTPSTRVGSASGEHMDPDKWYLADPRTERLPVSVGWFGTSLKPSRTASFDKNTRIALSGLPTEPGFVTSSSTSSYYPGDLMVNSPTDTYYKDYWADPDGVVRPADGVFNNRNTGDGLMLFRSTATPTGGGYATGDSGGNISHGRRPVVLNRPFRSVGELGYVFRDQPFKTLDFFTSSSADSALLDVFGLTDTARVEEGEIHSVTVGQFNPNAAPFPVIQALLAGGAKKEADATYNLTGVQVKAIAENLAILLSPASGPAPVPGLAGLAQALGSDPATGSGPVRNAFTNSPDKGNKAYLEAPIRALSDVGNLRTWNLLIDLVVQSGKISQNASGLEDFLVEGERRFWLHLALDRYTGEVVGQQLEPVYE